MRIFYLLLLLPSLLFSQSEDQNTIFDKNVKSIELYRDGFPISKPWIRLGSNEQLVLSFDILDNTEETIYYTFVHCDANREPSELQKYEYLKGFEENEMQDGEPSFQMKQDYIHYGVKFPNEDVQLTKSGNYKIIVYRENPEEPLFIHYFWIVEQRVNIEGEVLFCSAAGMRNTKQEIDFEIGTKRIDIFNPYDDLTVTIMQNGDWDNRIQGINPKTVGVDVIDYRFDGLICMDGLNEFRQFNTKSLYTQSNKVDRIYVKHDSVHVKLFMDKTRGNLAYFQTDDMNGFAFIRSQDRQNYLLESEYTQVYFSLESPYPVQDAEVYIYGGLTNWKISEESRMTYDYKTHQYHSKLYLKQGIYDYEYLVVEKNGNYDYTYFENSHSETQNQYTIFVYYHEPSSFYDRLIGIKSMESFERK